MSLPSFPIFDYVPDNLCPWCPYVTYTNCWSTWNKAVHHQHPWSYWLGGRSTWTHCVYALPKTWPKLTPLYNGGVNPSLHVSGCRLRVRNPKQRKTLTGRLCNTQSYMSLSVFMLWMRIETFTPHVGKFEFFKSFFTAVTVSVLRIRDVLFQIPDPIFPIPDPKSETQKTDKVLKNKIQDVHPGSRLWIFFHPGSRGQKSTGSRIRIRNTGQSTLFYLLVSVKVVIIFNIWTVCWNFLEKSLVWAFHLVDMDSEPAKWCRFRPDPTPIGSWSEFTTLAVFLIRSATGKGLWSLAKDHPITAPIP